MTLTLDLIDGASLETRSGGRKHTRMGMIRDISVSDTNDPFALVKALVVQGMPQVGQKHPSGDGSVVIGHRLIGCANNQARVQIFYDVPGGLEIPATVFYVEDSTVLVTRSTQVVPGTGYQCIVYADVGDQTEEGVHDVVSVPYLVPLRSLRFRGTTKKKLSDKVLECIGTANSARWNGLDEGFWLCAEVVVSAVQFDVNSKPSLYYVSASFLSNQRRNWSEYLFLRKPDGKTQKVDTGDMGALEAAPYSYGLPLIKSGATKVGLYPTSNFSALFGAIFKL